MQAVSLSSSNRARTEKTLSSLIHAARQLFADQGYAATSTPDIARAAGVTRGALYHHFPDKAGLFRAVVAKEFEAVAASIEAASADAAGSPLEALRQGSRGFLGAMQDRGRVRIMLLDGPAVLGHAEMTRIDSEASADALRRGLSEAMVAKQIPALPVEPLTMQFSAMFDRAALAVSEGDNVQDHLEVFDALFTALERQ